MKIRVMAFVDDENNDYFEGCRDENGFYVRDSMVDKMIESQACYDISESDFDDWMDNTFEDFNIEYDTGYDCFDFSRSASEILYDLDREAYCQLENKFIDNEMYDFVEQILAYCDENNTEVYLCFGDGCTYSGTIKEIEIEIDNNQDEDCGNYEDEDCGNYEVEEVLDVKIEPPIFQLNISDLLQDKFTTRS